MYRRSWKITSLLGIVSLTGAVMATPVTNGLKAWFRADTGVTTDSNGNVIQWNDLSGNNNHATQTNANRRPGLTTTVMSNGLTMAVVQFYKTADGTYDQLDLPNIPQQQAGCTAYFVANDDPDAGRSPVNWLNRVATSSPYPPAFYGRSSSATKRGIFIDKYPSYWSAEITPIPSGWTLTRFMWDSWNTSTFVTNYASGNGAYAITENVSSVFSSWVTIGLAGYNQHTFASFAEILIYDRALTETERQQVEEYLRHRYWTGQGAVGGQVVPKTLILTDYVGNSYQWQKSANGNTWDDIPGAQGLTLDISTLYESTPWFRVKVTASNTVYTAPVSVTVTEKGEETIIKIK